MEKSNQITENLQKKKQKPEALQMHRRLAKE
jgi:hypothetical protein